MRNIVLTGFMGTGKSEVSKMLIKILGCSAIDVDTKIEQSQKMTIADIFKKLGESRFREIETEMIKFISKNKNSIISTGGGAPLKEENMRALRENGIIVCLTAEPETILKRTAKDNQRPLLQVDNPLEKIKELMQAREPYYEKADIVISTENKTPLEIANEIVRKVKNEK
ncbi:MAG: shikimate kinase [Nitrospiraceae bacterium]|nr:shikimate kinase [Nitrospiraceae bacterium]